MRPLTIACVLLAFPVHAVARPNDEILREAQTAFRDGVEHKDKLLQARRDFARAADAYLELHRNGVRNMALYRELGNAAYLADRWPEAIWAFHMGLRLDANDRVLRENLAHARKKILYPASGQGRPEVDTWPTWLHRPTSAQWFWLFVFAHSLGCTMGTLAWLRHNNRFAALAVVAFALAIGAAAGLWIEADKASLERESPLVVVAVNAPFFRGNSPSYPQHAAVPILPRGLEARIIHRRGDWLQLRLTTGEVGWLPRNQVLIVEP